MSQRAKRGLTGLAIGLGATLVVLLGMGIATYQTFELRLLDVRFALRPPVPQTDRLLHIDIDDQSVNALGRWPWPRRTHATFVSTLAELDPRAIVFDVEFPDPSEPSYDTVLLRENVDSTLRSISQGLVQLGQESEAAREAMVTAVGRAQTDDDRVFARAIARAGNVYLPISFEPEGSPALDPERMRRIEGFVTAQFRAGIPEIAGKLGIGADEVERCITLVREEIAYGYALEALRKDVALTDEAIWAGLAGGSDEPLSSGSVNASVVRQACRMARAVRLMETKATLPIPTEALEEPFPVRRTFAPVPCLAEAARGGGFVSVRADPLDGKMRRLKVLWEADGRVHAHLMLGVSMDVLGVPPEGVRIEEGPTLVLQPADAPEVRLPLDDLGQAIVDWVPGEWARFYGPHLPYSRVVSLARMHVEIGRLLESAILRQELPVDLAEWRRRISALAPGEARDPSDSVTSGERGLSRIRELEAEMEAAVEAEVRRLDQEIAGLGEGGGRAYRSFLKAAREAVGGALAAVQGIRKEAAALEEELRSRVRGKVCVIGASHFGSTDIKATPFYAEFPAVSLQSSLFNMVESRSRLRRAAPSVSRMAVLLVGLFVSLVSISAGPIRAGLMSLGVLFVYLVAGSWVFFQQGLWVDFVGPILAAALGYTGIIAHRGLMSAQDRKEVEALWGQYVSPGVVDLMLKHPEMQRIFAERRLVTTLFSDVSGFTAECERLPAETVRDLINSYLEEMSTPILERSGYLNKYEGDAIMACWGAPISQGDQAVQSCLAAIEMMEKLKVLQRRFLEEGLPLMHTRIGINTGHVLVGNFGSNRKFDYTVIGDHVNLASRLEGANKSFQTAMLISEATRESAREVIEVRSLGKVRVQGRDQPVVIHELLGRKGELSEAQRAVRERFEGALDAFMRANWQEATAGFRGVLELAPLDGPSRFYLSRIAELSVKSLPEGWDGVVALETK